MLQLPSLPTCLGAGRLPGACVVVTQGLTGVQARPPADSLNPCSLEQPGGARPRAWAWLPVLVTLRGQRRPAGLAGHRGRPSVPREILHGTAPPGHRGRPGWLAPLSGAQGLGTGPLLTLHPGLNISERLSVQVRGGRGQSPTSTSGSSGTGSHRLDNACGGVCGRLDLWSRTSLCYRGQDRDVGRWLGLGPPAQMPADGAEHLEGRAWTGPRPELDRGALGLALGHPFDTVKVRLQTQTTYRGIVDCVVKTYRHESIPGFFKGMSFPLASVAVVNSVLFGVYSNALLVLTATSHQERRVQPPSYTHVFVAGCTGGFLQGASPETWHLRPPTGRNAGVPGPARPGPPASSPALREVEQITVRPVGTGWGPCPGTRGSPAPRSPGLRSPPPRRGCQVALPVGSGGGTRAPFHREGPQSTALLAGEKASKLGLPPSNSGCQSQPPAPLPSAISRAGGLGPAPYTHTHTRARARAPEYSANLSCDLGSHPDRTAEPHLAGSLTPSSAPPHSLPPRPPSTHPQSRSTPNLRPACLSQVTRSRTCRSHPVTALCWDTGGWGFVRGRKGWPGDCPPRGPLRGALQELGEGDSVKLRGAVPPSREGPDAREVTLAHPQPRARDAKSWQRSVASCGRTPPSPPTLLGEAAPA
ncbi:solute carrier family 25 member 45 isoform 2-T4 [Glossophaga mutica]